MNVIEARGVDKYYGNFQAIKNVNFAIKQGQIVGLIGANGAGKTTLLKALLGLTDCKGDLQVLGLDPRAKRTALMERMCFIADVAILPRWLRVDNAISFVEGVHPRFDRYKALEFLSRTKIKMHHKVKELSKGMVVQLHLALVMAIDVEILVLDEPTLGLDILYRSEFYQTIINDYYTENRTIVITTHQVEEIETILTDLMIIDNGQLILDSSMDELANRFVAVSVTPDKVEAMEKLNPLYHRKAIGHVDFIFEGRGQSELSAYGDVSMPSVSDIFVAKVGGK